MARPTLAGFLVVVLGCGGAGEPPKSADGATQDSPARGTPATAPSSTADAPADVPPAVAEPALPAVDLVESDAAPSPSKLPSVSIGAPARGQVVPAAKAADLAIKLTVRDWDLGPGRGSLCVSLDSGPCVRFDDPKRSLKLSDLSTKLAEGQHVLAVIARHPSGEAVRSKGKNPAFAAVSFFVEKRGKPGWKDGDPLVIPLPPDEARAGEVLIDYFVGNAEMADGKYLAQIALAAPGLNRGESSSSGRPFRVKNARPGGYLLRVALARYSPELGESGSSTTVKYTSKTLVGPLVDVTRTFQVTR